MSVNKNEIEEFNELELSYELIQACANNDLASLKLLLSHLEETNYAIERKSLEDNMHSELSYDNRNYSRVLKLAVSTDDILKSMLMIAVLEQKLDIVSELMSNKMFVDNSSANGDFFGFDVIFTLNKYHGLLAPAALELDHELQYDGISHATLDFITPFFDKIYISEYLFPWVNKAVSHLDAIIPLHHEIDFAAEREKRLQYLFGYFANDGTKRGVMQEMINLICDKLNLTNRRKEVSLELGTISGNVNAAVRYLALDFVDNAKKIEAITKLLDKRLFKSFNLISETPAFKKFYSTLSPEEKSALKSVRNQSMYSKWLKLKKRSVLNTLLPQISALKHADATKKDSALIESNKYVKNRFQGYPYENHLRDSIIPEAFPELTQHQCNEAAKMVVKAYDMLKIKSNDSRKRKRDEVDESSTNKRAKYHYCSVI